MNRREFATSLAAAGCGLVGVEAVITKTDLRARWCIDEDGDYHVITGCKVGDRLVLRNAFNAEALVANPTSTVKQLFSGMAPGDTRIAIRCPRAISHLDTTEHWQWVVLGGSA